jgi:hypothetical protein
MKLVGHMACKGERRGTYRVWLERAERKGSLGKLRHGWESNIKTNLQEVE